MQPQSIHDYPLLEALRGRRSRRFGLGMKIEGGPLAYQSRFEPAPLTEDEEAALAFAACGITGPALADLCFAPGKGGNIMAGLVGRTMATGDGLQTVVLIVMNDEATYLLRRPQDFPPAAIPELIGLGQQGAFTELYRRSRVRIKDGRVRPPLDPPFNLNVNRGSLHARGTSYFLPINDVTQMYLNGVLEILNEDTGLFVLDERNGYRPAGLAPFARSRGGQLDDNLAHGRVVTVRLVEQLVTEFVTVEQGMVLQNLGLMTQALGLGGFNHFANHEFGWFQALGFRMAEMPASRYLGVGGVTALAMRALGRDANVPYVLGLERDGDMLLKPFCPPYYPSMNEAVDAAVAVKFGPNGVLRRARPGSGWREPEAALAAVPAISDRAIAATKAYCGYLWDRYGRFPVHLTPYRTVLGYQAAHVDAEFYDRFYRPEALTETQRRDFARRTASQSPGAG
jgi:hypothetical protein